MNTYKNNLSIYLVDYFKCFDNLKEGKILDFCTLDFL